MALGPSIQLRQSQQLVMTPQLTQAIKLLALSNLELESAIAEEVANNPLLEIGDSDEDSGPVSAEVASAEEPAGALDDDRPLDFDFDAAALETDSFSDVSVPSRDGEGFDFDRLEACETSLCEHLLAQLHGSSGPTALLASIIIQQLDENGYLTTPLAAIAADAGASLAEAEQALALVQSLDPPGVSARSLAECLALQARAADRYDPAMARMIDNLELLARGRMADLKRICGVDDEDLADMVRELRAYDPKPGFFERGVSALKPLTLRQVAEAIEMHESTVSRVTSNKYLLCDRGLYELKYFFGSGVASSQGEGAAAEAVKAAIHTIIAAETEILSDDAIAAVLKQRGFDCARRTVVKYREAMGIGSSVQRRRQRKISGG